jgi:hypothetical protein
MQKVIILHKWVGSAIASLLLPTLMSSASLASPNFSRINSALNYPTSSQRFFNEGIRRLEQEIRRMTQERSADATEPLHIDEDLPTIQEEQRSQLERPNVPDHRQEHH